MTKSMIRCLCALLALMLVCASTALAETVTKTYKTYTPVDEKVHTVDEETWEYPIVNGSAGSGKPASDSSLGSGEPVSDDSLGSGRPTGGDSYDEPHTYENGVCIYCGYAGETFTNAMGVVLTKGMPAADALKLVFDAIPASANPSIVGATADAGDKLTGLVKNGGEPATYVPALSAFPAETVDNTPCSVVTLAYTDATGNAVTENYAFDAADATFFKLY